MRNVKDKKSTEFKGLPWHNRYFRVKKNNRLYNRKHGGIA